MIREAVIEDMNAILGIVSKALVLMKEDGNDQWNSSYPSYDDFYKDVVAGDLFVDTDRDGTVRSVICLNRQEPDEYGGIPWKVDKPALVIHRMAVDPQYHGKGLAKKLFHFAEERALELKIAYIRSDTCSRNVSMNGLFKRMGYEFSGTLRFPERKYDFNCYEKILAADGEE